MTRRISNRNQHVLQFEKLDERILLARDSVYINEFLANNDSTMADADGHFSDWIELYNPTTEPVNLAGWALTDAPDETSKWVFPFITIPGHGFQIVFASNKNRRDPSAELHANFKLSSDGEYLALVKPNRTIAHEFNAYPVQTSDISFGFASEEIPLIASSAIGSYRIPTEDDSAANDWQDVSFDDNQWPQARGAIGYDNRPRLENAGFENEDLSAWKTRGPVSIVDDSFGISPAEGSRMAVASTKGSTATRSGAEFALGLPAFALDGVNAGSVQRVAAIHREVVANAGSVLTLDWNFLTNDIREDFAFVYVTDSSSVSLLADPSSNLVGNSATGYSWETGFRRYEHTFETAGTYTVGVGVAQAIDLFDDSALAVDDLRMDGIGDPGASFELTVETYLNRDVENTVWWRHSFEHDATVQLDSLLLRIRYDDGFVAFINGQQVASRNAPETLLWNSSATNSRDNQSAIGFEEIHFSSSMIKPGRNVLSIQGLNSETDTLDFLLDPKLVGVRETSDEPTYLRQPTPAGPNFSPTFVESEYVEEVKFDRLRGFYTDPFMLVMSTDPQEATIRYTTDGSVPTGDTGEVYVAPLRIASTTVVRAAAFKDGLSSRASTTASYLFLEEIIKQSTQTAVASGFSPEWPDYELDPDVIGLNGQDLFDGKYARTIRDDLLSLPTMSLVLDRYDLFGDQGVFVNPEERGIAWERAASMELIHADGAEGFQVDAGLRIHGGISRTTSDKLSMRLLFRETYGNGKLEYPLFGADGPARFDSIVLRSSGAESAIGFHYIRDETVRRIEQATGNRSALGMFVHLYINGLYWGLYNPTERIDAQFTANRDGGVKEDYDIYNTGDLGKVSPIQGTIEPWDRLVALSNDIGSAANEASRTRAFMRLQGRNADGTDNPTLESYLDVDNFINYLVINLYAGNSDWPSANYYLYRRRGPASEGFKFLVWDAEFTFDAGDTRQSMVDLALGPTTIVRPLLMSEAFRVQFSDRVQRLFSPGGALYVNPEFPDWNPEHPDNNMPARVYAAVANSVHSSIVAESARWGDIHEPINPLFTRDEDWSTVVDMNLKEFFPRRSAQFLEQLRNEDLYRDAPSLGLLPGQEEVGSTLTLASRVNAPIYFTTDGTDPRLVDGGVAPNAVLYAEPIPITDSMSIRARSLDGSKWSAIDEGTYLDDELPANSDNLRITELHYHPETNGNAEFLELTNIGSKTIRLDGVRVEGGVTFDFPPDETKSLGPGERIVLVRDREAFSQIYPGLENFVAGQYVGNLSNGGEQLTLRGADGNIIQQFEYHDRVGWPTLADGHGPSLQLIDPSRDANLASNWRASAVVGGTPGAPEYQVGDSNLDGRFDSSDLVLVFQGGEYEDAIEDNSSWRTGDWTGDLNFTTADLVLAFQAGSYSALSVAEVTSIDVRLLL